MEGPSTFEPESGKNSAEEIGGMGEGERPDSEHLQQDAGAQTTEDKRTRALAACMEQRLAYIKCLRMGLFHDCSKNEKALWDCYAEKGGIKSSNRFALFRFSPKE